MSVSGEDNCVRAEGDAGRNEVSHHVWSCVLEGTH